MEDDKTKPPVLLEQTEAQTVTILLADGRVGSFVGPALFTDADGKTPKDLRVGIKQVQFSAPFPLAPGVFFVRRDDGNLALATQASPATDPLKS